MFVELHARSAFGFLEAAALPEAAPLIAVAEPRPDGMLKPTVGFRQR